MCRCRRGATPITLKGLGLGSKLGSGSVGQREEGRVCSCGSVGRCVSLRRGTLGLTRGVWEGGAWRVRMGWGTEARGTRQAAGGSGRRQAAGGRRQAAGRLPTKLAEVGVGVVLPGRTSRASRRRSVSRVCTRGWSVVEVERGAWRSGTCHAGRSARRRRRGRRAAEGEHEDGIKH
eukprot:scaffold18659_cov58-Phaeocystis_antarctica.AAC.1